MVDLSVIIVTYRTPEMLRRCLERLLAHPSRSLREILVVDNNSGDACPEIARSFPGVKVIETGENLGFAGGVNRGIENAEGRYLFVMNPDVEVTPGSVDALIDFLESHPETGIAAPKLLNPDGSLQASCRRFYTPTTILLRRTFLGKLFPNAASLRRHLMLDYDHAEPRAVDWVAGAAMMVRREAVEDVGPLDERYFLYFEDVDWCARMQARGWLVHYVPESVMTHHWGRASTRSGPAARRHLRSGLRFYDRWGGLLHLIRQDQGTWRAVALVLLDLVAITLALLVAFALRSQLAFVLHKPAWPLAFYKGFFAASVGVYLGAFAIQGLYREIREGDWIDVAFRIGKAATLGALVLMASTFVLDMRSYSRAIILASWPLAAFCALIVRRVLFALFVRTRRERWNLRRVAIVGEEPILDRLERTLKDNPELGWEPVRLRRTPWRDLPAAEGEGMLVQILTRERVSEAVVTPRSLGVPEEDVSSRILPLRRAGIGVRLVTSFLASLPARARVERVGDLSWLSLERPRLRPSRFTKRVLDVAMALLFLVLGLLPWVLGTLARGFAGKKLWEPEEAWVGRWGEVVRVRRMRGPGWFGVFPLVPQVLRGRLSLVGPRPLRPGEAVPGGDAWLRVRELHRPGLVGPWSLAVASSPEEEMQQEIRYLEEWSPELDLKLLARVALHRSRNGTGRGSSSPSKASPDAAKPAPSARPGRAHSMGIS